MTLEEARGELGVAAEAEPDLVRRTYLRMLKTRKPEVDPQGFARLREAYELLKAAHDGTEAPRTSAAPEPVAPATVDAPHASGPLSADARLDTFRARFSTLPSDAPTDAPVLIAREAVESLPEAGEARHWLIKALMASNRKEEATQAFRDAFNQGHPEFLLAFAQTFPQRLTEAEINLLGTTAAHPFLWGLAEELGTSDDWDKAGQAALVALAAIKRHPEHPPPKPTWVLAFLLQLHLNGRPREARALQASYSAWLEAEGLLGAFKEQDEAWVWMLVQELGELDDDVSPGVRKLLAHAVLNGNLENTREQMRAYRRREPERAAHALEQIRARCPSFHAALGESLVPKGPTPGAKRPSPPKKAPGDAKPPAPGTGRSASRYTTYALASVGVLMATMVAVGVMTFGLKSSPEEAQEGPREGNALEARLAVRALCELLPDPGAEDTCAGLSELVDTAEADECPKMGRKYLKMRAVLQEQTAPVPANEPNPAARRARLNEAQYRLVDELRRFCPRYL
ncbi:hypothetical protein FJV41_31505 [Myxococcus llanfairpwllgwyngyllgogerychwyrndrobwllllantysiliogogogochensis]|uniref:J domain-containing protein n=1 Tax=Myxococcus llanfairpwllgwyngyllgogerychwyrndrobwllllantysiliogogogochensis TaxID=2590453 RepID=A0A540WSL7_9BACT|nr:hypothetical protein [Myxococcus llanfairpwllgwyngyllgogerychwyrndrobwllllantysiliogogogochensis]TQF11950.1 hypothetical protein FJV41_31505 [Myxococcus llanfairpwllgwyngyllgogerychwyrndrobwllllantysiliogogogochensis]